MTIYHGDNLIILPSLARKSVQTVVTSPPYFGLRDYKLPSSLLPAIEYTPMPGLPSIVIPEQAVCLGLETDPLAYVGHLVHVFRLLWGVLRDDGTAWLNLGDSYASNPASEGQQSSKMTGGEHKHTPRDVYRRPDGLKPKDLIGIPWRVVYALQSDGWYLRSDIVWEKSNAMPESVKDRPTKAHEYVFLLSKQERYYYDTKAIAELATEYTAHTRGRARNVGGRNDGYTTPVGNVAPLMDGFRNARTVWSIPTRALAEAHYAPMPEALAERCIRAGSRPGDMVLDPFAGTGTVGRVCEKLGRESILIELSDAYIDICDRRTTDVQMELIDLR